MQRQTAAPPKPENKEGVGAFFKSVVAGDFDANESWSATAGKVIGGLNPLADVRDIAAGVKHVAEGKQGAWVDLGTSALGAVPIVGDAGKALIRGGRKVAKEAAEGAAQAAAKQGVEAAAKQSENITSVRQTGARDLKYDDFDGAERVYDEIRRTSSDAAAIARNTGMRESQVTRIKEHLFHRTHKLDDGVRRFDADPDIANAWKRMEAGTHSPKDIQLLDHELFESRFEGIFRTDYRTAHQAMNRSGRPSGLE